ncbi:MAG: alpha,alpha-trehalose-phosphate synthase (UDP-forming) [Azospirillaceae bacterium]
MSRLVVASNRVAPVRGKKAASTGGLAVAIQAALKQTGGIWFGWSGEVSPDTRSEPQHFQSGQVTFATIDLSVRDYDEYYNGFSNKTLWPLFHYRLDLAALSRRTQAGYARVNTLFATRIGPMLEADDLIWVHDYHLIPLGDQLRQMGFTQRMGFFLHIPFPPPELLVALPHHETLVRSLCAYDVVGFQTSGDCRAFLRYLTEEAGAEVLDDGLVSAYGRILKVAAFPISIETGEIVEQAARSVEARQAQRLRASLHKRDMIIGVDRLDYSKGLPQRMQAFSALLENYAGNRGHVIFMQIAPPTREDVEEYQEIRHQLETVAGHINGAFAEFDWIPIRYLNKSFSRANLLAFYRAAKVGLVTPLRDGMNLVAKEYVAAQNPKDPGVLVLSRFAGAAEEMAGGALIVNPYDIEGVAEALQRALTMTRDERRERYEAMMAVLRENTIERWLRDFSRALHEAPYAA